jgi:hypothetical protein
MAGKHRASSTRPSWSAVQAGRMAKELWNARVAELKKKGRRADYVLVQR